MDNYHSAFLPGEHARLQSRSLLIKLNQKHNGTPEQLGLHNVITPDMAEHAGKRVLITGRSYYHMGWVLYELDGLTGYWPEAALIDQQMLDDDDPNFQPANLTYVAVKSDDGGFVDIRSSDGRRFCSFRRYDADQSVDDVNRVAKLRTRVSFALRYGFDGVEHDDYPKPQS